MINFDTSRQRQPTQEESEIVQQCLREFSQLQTWRNTFAQQWEEIASLIDPMSRNTFFYGTFNWPGQKRTEYQIDATGMMALHRFGAICDSLLTPRNMVWHQLQADDTSLMKSRRVRLYYEAATRAMFKHRYAPAANFSAQNQGIYRGIGAYGTACMFVDQAENAAGVPIPELRYKACPLGEMFLLENHQGLICGFIRWFRLTAQQAAQKWGADNLPDGIKVSLQQGSQMTFDFLHRVAARSDYDPTRLDYKGKAFSSYYVSITGQCIMSEGGYNTFPLAATRYDQTSGEVYGRSPAMMVLPALKTLNAQKRTFLKAGHRAADPVLLTTDDGLVDFNMRPGALNKGGMSMDGKPLIGVLPVGDIQISKEMMAEEKGLIQDAFLVSLFQILLETPQMTATEVIERTNEKGILLAPTIGRQQSEYLGPLIERELDLMSELGLLPEMPPELIEAKGEYSVSYTSPMARAQRAQEVAGMARTLETTLRIVEVTQDPEPLDNFDFDIITRDTAMIQAVPESWMRDPKVVEQKRAQRAEQQQAQMEIQAAPAAAAMMKARAAQAKAGGGGQG